MILALAVAAPRNCNAGAFLASLEDDGVFLAPDVAVHIAQDAAQPFGPSLPGIAIETALPGASIFQLWGAAIRAAEAAPFVAVLDARCPISPGWLSAMRQQIQQRPIALYGPVACGWPTVSPHVVGYLVEYAQFHPPFSPRLREIPGLNLVVDRRAATSADVLRADGFVKTRLLASVAASGRAALAVETAAVVYRKTFDFGSYCANRYRHGRCYGADRTLPGLWPRLRALLSTPALPALRTWRIYLAARDARMEGGFWRWLHRIVLAETAWSAGEFLGSVAGAGACRQKLV